MSRVPALIDRKPDPSRDVEVVEGIARAAMAELDAARMLLHWSCGALDPESAEGRVGAGWLA